LLLSPLAQAQCAQCWKTPIEPDRRSPCPPQRRALPNTSTNTDVTVVVIQTLECITYLLLSPLAQARCAQCWKTPIEPDRRSPCPPQRRALPSSLHTSAAASHTHSCETRLIHARQQVPCIHDTSVLLLNNCVQHDVNDHSLDEPRLPS